jgi:hypothetical protein
MSPMHRMRILNILSLAVALYSFASWVYVALVALILPQTLPLQLTHLTRWPRTDTFGELSFIVSFLAFITYMLTRRWDGFARRGASAEFRGE